MSNYSAFRLFVEGLRNQTGWTRAWRDPQPKPSHLKLVTGKVKSLPTVTPFSRPIPTPLGGAGMGLSA